MKTTRLLTLAALALSLSLPMAFAQKAPAPAGRPAAMLALLEGGGPIERVQEFLTTLDLSAAQKEQIKKIVADAKAEWETWRDNHKDEIAKIKEEIKAAREAKDREKFQAIAEQVKALLKDAPKPGENLQKIKAVLTPEQQAKLEAKLTEIRENRETRREQRQDAPAAK